MILLILLVFLAIDFFKHIFKSLRLVPTAYEHFYRDRHYIITLPPAVTRLFDYFIYSLVGEASHAVCLCPLLLQLAKYKGCATYFNTLYNEIYILVYELFNEDLPFCCIYVEKVNFVLDFIKL